MRKLLPFALLAALVACCYANALHGGFVFDDELTIQKNAPIREGVYSDIRLGRSLLYWTYAANYRAGGQNTAGYHAVNIALHLASIWILFAVAGHILGQSIRGSNRVVSFAAAALFAVHPLQTEAVTYISQRSELLSLAFFLAGFWLFLAWPFRRGVLLAVALMVPFLAAISSKETAIVLPAVCLLYDWCFRRPKLTESDPGYYRQAHHFGDSLKFYGAWLAAALAVAYRVGTHTLRDSIGAGLPGHLSNYSYFLTELTVIPRYIGLMLWPAHQNADPEVIAATSVFSGSVLASALLLTAIAIGALLSQPVAKFAAGWFFLTLLPTSSVIPILDPMFEHRLYLPLAGACLLFPLLCEKLGSVTFRKLEVA